MPVYLQIFFVILMILLLAALVGSLLAKLFRLALGMAFLTFLVPILITITWGDGSQYVADIASLFRPDIEESINHGYQVYQKEYGKNPAITDEELLEVMDYASENAQKTLAEYIEQNSR